MTDRNPDDVRHLSSMTGKDWPRPGGLGLRAIFGLTRTEVDPRAFSRLYLLLAMPSILFLNIVFTAFHAPDDYDHVKRASTLLNGQVWPTTMPGRSSGGYFDTGLLNYIAAQKPVIAVRHRSLSAQQRTDYRESGSIHWSDRLAYSEAPGAMSYMPALYAPQAAMLAIARASGASVEMSVFLARLGNGLAGMLLAALGLRILTTGHGLVLVTMLLPKTLVQFASNSADPILFGATVLLIGCAIRIWRSPRISKGGALGLGLLYLGIATVRPPLAALSLPYALTALRMRSWRGVGFVAIVTVGVLAWFAAVIPSVTDLRCGELGAVGDKLLRFATDWPSLIGRSVVEHYAYYGASFIGELGWGNGPGGRIEMRLPIWAYAAAIGMLGLAIGYDVQRGARLSAGLRATMTAVAMVTTVLVFFAMYAACTNSAGATIGGVQGRYLVPSVLALAPALAGAGLGRSRSVWSSWFPGALILWTMANVIMLGVLGYGLYWQV